MNDKRTQAPLVALHDVSVTIDDHLVLDEVNLQIMAGDYWGVVGPNGGGKTTLLRTILGLVEPRSGRIERTYGIRFGYVPQASSCNRRFPVSVRRTILLGSHRFLQHGRRAKDAMAKADELIDALGLRERQHSPIGGLSGGELQRTLLARALMNETDLLVLDEPTASLDTEYTSRVYELLERLNEHTTLIMVSHDLSAVSSYVKQVACINKKMYCHGEPKNLNKSLEQVYGCPVDLIAHGHPHRVFPDH